MGYWRGGQGAKGASVQRMPPSLVRNLAPCIQRLSFHPVQRRLGDAGVKTGKRKKHKEIHKVDGVSITRRKY
jgi:hypothetical protein